MCVCMYCICVCACVPVCVCVCVCVCSLPTGGAPDTVGLTGGRFSGGMRGCVRSVSLMSARPGGRPAQAIDLQAHAAHGINVRPCTS